MKTPKTSLTLGGLDILLLICFKNGNWGIYVCFCYESLYDTKVPKVTLRQIPDYIETTSFENRLEKIYLYIIYFYSNLLREEDYLKRLNMKKKRTF